MYTTTTHILPSSYSASFPATETERFRLSSDSVRRTATPPVRTKSPSSKDRSSLSGSSHSRPSTKTATEISTSSFPSTVHIGNDGTPTSSLFDWLRPSLSDRGRPKYNGLKLKRQQYVQSGRFERNILKSDEKLLAAEKTALLEDMEHSLDDYFLRYDERDYPRDCVRPAWTDWQFPSCNSFHESMTLERVPDDDPSSTIRYLAHGHYRDTFLWKSDSEEFVLKHLRLKDYLSFKFTVTEQIRTEALLMERLLASPRTTNIYGYCATSLVVETAMEITEDIVPFTSYQDERGRISQRKLDLLQQHYNTEIFSFNNYTVEEKLDIAIQVVEAVAEMHGFSGSVIVNDDVHPDQWLQVPTASGRRVILNDMNNAVFLEWNPVEQVYCQYYREFGGDFHAPEEFVGSYVDESTDIWSVGNMIFILLTGLWPYYDLPYSRRVELQQLTIAGELPYINPAYKRRSLIEHRLIEVMNLCYKREPADRIDIFQVLQHLRHTAKLHAQEQEKKQQEAVNG
jgi:Protein kinase domain